MDVDIDKDQYPHLTIEDIEKSIVIQNSDAIDGFEITTNLPRLDNTRDFFLWDGVIVKKELIQPELTEVEKNKNERSSMSIQEINRLKNHYPAGTRIELISMNDPFAPVPSGMRGSVDYVDDAGQIHMKWDNGRTLAVLPGVDSFRKLTPEEIEAESPTEDISEDNPISM